MSFLRRGFYLLIGFTFPGFWLLHAAGLLARLYHPLQLLFHTEATLWPSLITAIALYLGAVVCFECIRAYLSKLSRE